MLSFKKKLGVKSIEASMSLSKSRGTGKEPVMSALSLTNRAKKRGLVYVDSLIISRFRRTKSSKFKSVLRDGPDHLLIVSIRYYFINNDSKQKSLTEQGSFWYLICKWCRSHCYINQGGTGTCKLFLSCEQSS